MIAWSDLILSTNVVLKLIECLFSYIERRKSAVATIY
jgi:hypothetical protein